MRCSFLPAYIAELQKKTAVSKFVSHLSWKFTDSLTACKNDGVKCHKNVTRHTRWFVTQSDKQRHT